MHSSTLSRRVALACAGPLAAGLVLSGCSAGHTAVVQAADTPAVVVASTASTTSLDFTTTGGAAIPAALMSNVYETLVTINPATGAIEPGLAQSWTMSPDGRVYTFQLRKGVRFSNGDEFTADTAAFSIDYVKNEWTNGLSSHMDAVKDARARDPYTLEVELSEPSQSWLWAMATAVGAMMTPGGIEDLAAHPVGTGPFEVSGFAPGEFVALKVREDYWGDPAVQDVTIQYFPDSLTSVNALQSGGADVVWAVQNPELLDTLNPSIGVQQGTTNGEVLLSMNNQAAPFDDPRVRQAVAFGVDRQAADAILFQGRATDTGGAPVAPTDPWFEEGQNYYPFDPARARALMEEAGAVGTPLTITVPTLPYTQTLSELLYSQLRDIGFDVTLESAEFPAVWLGQVMGAKDYQMSLIAHVEPRDIVTLFGNPDYYLGYDNARVRELFARADAAPSGAAGTELMREAVDAIMADAGALTVMNMPNIVLTAPGVAGIDPNQVTDAIPLRDVHTGGGQ